MDKHPHNKRTKSLDSIIRKIFKLKLRKPNSWLKVRPSFYKMDSPHSIEYKPSRSSQQHDDYYDYQYDWQYRKISPDDLRPFCDQLGKFLKYVRSIQELVYLTYDYPSVLQNRLEKDSNELQSLYLEVRDAVNSIERLKSQRKAVKKEKSAVKKNLRKLREDEVREMENIVSQHDKAMFTRWENVKNTHKPDVLEHLLHDIKGKQQAMDHLNTLVARKLGQLQVFMPLSSNTENGGSGLLNNGKEKSFTSTGSTGNANSSTDEEKPGPPHCITVRRHHPHSPGTNTGRTSPFRRRRHHDRQETHNNSRYITSQQVDSNGIDLPLVPFSVANSPFQIVGPIISDGASSNHSLLPASSSSNTANTVRNNETTTPNGTAVNGVGSEFQSEMRTVLQALFGELRQTTPTTIAFNNNVDTGESSTNTNREIELYTLRRPAS